MRPPTTNVCSVTGCDRKYKCKGYCQLHYERLKNTGSVGAIDATKYRVRPFSFVDDSTGYEYFCPADSKEKILMHRHVMEQHLGRRLMPAENVHHINGQRWDNRIENLELWSRAQPSGQRVSDKIRWALEIIERYGDNPNAFRHAE